MAAARASVGACEWEGFGSVGRARPEGGRAGGVKSEEAMKGSSCIEGRRRRRAREWSTRARGTTRAMCGRSGMHGRDLRRPLWARAFRMRLRCGGCLLLSSACIRRCSLSIAFKSRGCRGIHRRFPHACTCEERSE